MVGFRLSEAWDFEMERGDLRPKPVQVGNELFFVNWTMQRGNELWKTDGTNAGKQMIADIVFGQSSGMIQVRDWVVIGNKLIFGARSLTHGVQLWASDGTKAGTVRLTSFSDELAAREGYQSLKTKGNFAYFVTRNAITDGAGDQIGATLWKTDGTPGGTRKVPLSINGRPMVLMNAGAYAFAFAGAVSYLSAMEYDPHPNRSCFDSQNPQYPCNPALYRINLDTNQVRLVKDINTKYSHWAQSKPDGILYFTPFGRSVVFSAVDRIVEQNVGGVWRPVALNSEVWISQGTAESTVKVKEIARGALGSDPHQFAPLR
jgi:ELWxxDGT repeat protein